MKSKLKKGNIVMPKLSRLRSHEHRLTMLKAGNGNRGVGGGIFGIPPWPKIFRKYPPLEILGQAAIFFK